MKWTSSSQGSASSSQTPRPALSPLTKSHPDPTTPIHHFIPELFTSTSFRSAVWSALPCRTYNRLPIICSQAGYGRDTRSRCLPSRTPDDRTRSHQRRCRRSTGRAAVLAHRANVRRGGADTRSPCASTDRGAHTLPINSRLTDVIRQSRRCPRSRTRRERTTGTDARLGFCTNPTSRAPCLRRR